MTQNNDRDEMICQDYIAGMEIQELERTYGISDRRVLQILHANGVALRPRAKKQGSKPVDQMHVSIGLRLYHHRHERNMDHQAAADALEWSMLKLRKVEKGCKMLTIHDVQNLASFLNIQIQELVETKRNG